MELKQEIAKYWAGGDLKPRKAQIEALNWLVENKHMRYLFVELPVGGGKSICGMTFSRYMNNFSYALTPQIILQKQYENDFKSDRDLNLASLYGKANYTCEEKGGVSCAIGSIGKRCEYCPYAKAREAAQKANNTVMNYKMALSSWKFTKIFKKEDTPVMRNLAICDEGHTFEDHLVSFDAIQITDKWCSDYGLKMPPKKTRNIRVVVDFIQKSYMQSLVETYDILLTEIELMQGNSENERQSTKKTKELKHVESQLNTCTELLKMSIDDIEEDYVMVDSPFGIELKRLYGHYSFNNIVKPIAKQFLFMSSTFLGKAECCAELGLDPEEVAYISIDSEFDPENRPVVYMPQMKMNFKWNDDANTKNRDKMLDTIKQISAIHEEENGIIHTGNFKIAEWLVENLDVDHEIIHHNPGAQLNRNEAIEHFLDSSTTPAILISPSSTEGLDLKGDLGGFAVFAKVPFGNMGDAWIKKRMSISSEWYQRRAMIDMIQGGGRIVRTPEDEGTTYILDESFGYLYNQNKKIVPQWWKDAYHEV